MKAAIIEHNNCSLPNLRPFNAQKITLHVPCLLCLWRCVYTDFVLTKQYKRWNRNEGELFSVMTDMAILITIVQAVWHSILKS